MFSRQSDERRTPRARFDELHREFRFAVDAAARRHNALLPTWLGPGHPERACRDGLLRDWFVFRGAVWFNPPYSRTDEFIGKAALERRRGVTSVGLVAARTDTRWWFRDVWDEERGRFRPGVSVRFIKGRLKFLDARGRPFRDKHGRTTGAAFPSVAIVFKGSSSKDRVQRIVFKGARRG